MEHVWELLITKSSPDEDQGLSYLMRQSCDSISVTSLSSISVTSLSEINNSENQTYSIIILTSSSVTTKISTTHFSFLPTVILVTEVTSLTVHPKSCYCEMQFLSTGFCSSFYVLRIEKSKLK